MRAFARTAAIALILAASTAAPALAAPILKFHAVLGGKAEPDNTGSDATGEATISVDTDRHLVSVDMTVHGITTDKLWKKLVAAPIGPVHFHEYKPDGSSVLALPLPYGATYTPTADGFHIVSKDYDYAAGAKLLNSTLSFDDFVAAIQGGKVVLNVHTEAFNPGEIGGLVVAG
jgi:hypothetical protein